MNRPHSGESYPDLPGNHPHRGPSLRHLGENVHPLGESLPTWRGAFRTSVPAVRTWLRIVLTKVTTARTAVRTTRTSVRTGLFSQMDVRTQVARPSTRVDAGLSDLAICRRDDGDALTEVERCLKQLFDVRIQQDLPVNRRDRTFVDPGCGDNDLIRRIPMELSW